MGRPPSARALRDEALKVEIARVYKENYGVYGPGRSGGSWAAKGRNRQILWIAGEGMITRRPW